jgi:hypothetical protein
VWPIDAALRRAAGPLAPRRRPREARARRVGRPRRPRVALGAGPRPLRHPLLARRHQPEGQLYFACDEGRPRLFDQGLAGFLFGTEDPSLGYLSIVLLPSAAAEALERVALDDRHALALLAGRYSANAYPYGLRYQNCNQWVAELLASAWGARGGDADARRSAQQWLAAQGYAPAPVEVGSHWLMLAANFIPWLHSDDHPVEDLYARRFRISLPTSIEAFVRQQLPASTRIELCHDERKVVVRRGWTPIGDGCRAEAGDRVLALD